MKVYQTHATDFVQSLTEDDNLEFWHHRLDRLNIKTYSYTPKYSEWHEHWQYFFIHIFFVLQNVHQR